MLITFPVIGLFDRLSIEVFDTNDELTTCSERLFAKSYFNNLHIVEMTGLAHIVKEARKIKAIGPLFGYNFSLDKILRVELIPIGEPFMMTFDEIHDKVCCFVSNPEYLESREASRFLRRKLNKAVDLSEIFEALRSDRSKFN